ncbi:MarR family winged helix-turn-helix transcriptional regulator [Burkholderia alba]|uniref:MarR family winged helix-turn-helix transcriptional regulator n=1 Tax=Burkholderia alba TaxID=2683677 RepID=UPI002B054E9A|nr:MarR family winged helix-turn-helix transcriptional regulator [Burkholderia alba]
MKRDLLQLRDALLDVTGVLNRPQPDAALIALAGVDLDRALFPLLARIERKGPLGIGELAELCGRDYTTVSRQVTKLEGLGLVARQVNGQDARIKEAVVTAKGRTMTRALDGAREKILTGLMAAWDPREVAELARLLRRFADDALSFVQAEKSRGE